ncbi:MAG: hypothetical protein Pg6A_19020 [Termitinemataceae bacterium]|nr:MAG: hypothetical protein Pg6A_19020 [Termitinemataceae bacterium]
MQIKIRKRALPPGWYPTSAEEVAGAMAGFKQAGSASSLTAVLPHAGWFFSLPLAAKAICSLSPEIETVIVAGGHLHSGSPVLFACEDAVETPLGNYEIDVELRDILQNKLGGKSDNAADNTVEVLLPAIKYIFPKTKLVWARFPPALSSFEAGRLIAQNAVALGRRAALLGSTDLSHYGASFNFTVKGYGEEALNWVKTVNDKSFIDAVLSGSAEAVLDAGLSRRAACSAGAVLCAQGFASIFGGIPRLLGYATSADVLRAAGDSLPDSFVGYAAFSWERY